MAAAAAASPCKLWWGHGSPDNLAPGELLHRLLLNPPEDDLRPEDELSPRHSRMSRTPSHSHSRSNSRSCSRSRSPSRFSSASASPQPKKMPGKAPKKFVVLTAKPKPGPTRPEVMLRPKSSALKANHCLAVPKHSAEAASVGSWTRTDTPRVVAPPRAPAAILTQAKTGGRAAAEERRCLEVLARHAARLGSAGPGLERAVWEAFVAAKQASKTEQSAEVPVSRAQRWSFLVSDGGFVAYAKERARFAEIYARNTKSQADRTVREMFSCGPFDGPAPRPIPAIKLSPPYRDQPCGMVELPISELRFAHNDQSELFAHNTQGTDIQSILQLAVELLCGITKPEDVPTFDVCVHEGLWYCRSGHRRLAAFRLAHRWSSGRLRRVKVKVVAVDTCFVKGTSGRPKLTTYLNGKDCKGKWLMIKETGEAVGREEPGHEEYGADLLSLLAPPPVPEPPKTWARNSWMKTSMSGG